MQLHDYTLVFYFSNLIFVSNGDVKKVQSINLLLILTFIYR